MSTFYSKFEEWIHFRFVPQEILHTILILLKVATKSRWFEENDSSGLLSAFSQCINAFEYSPICSLGMFMLLLYRFKNSRWFGSKIISYNRIVRPDASGKLFSRIFSLNVNVFDSSSWSVESTFTTERLPYWTSITQFTFVK